jgi:2-alkyl-3-oxoalkanoate reductase
MRSRRLQHRRCRPDTPAHLASYLRASGGPAPARITEEEALVAFGADTVYYATRLRGASNEKAKREFKFQPRPLERLAAQSASK